MNISSLVAEKPVILSYYHPWIAGGGHRPGQMLNHDLKKDKEALFIFCSSDGIDNIHQMLSMPEYNKLTLVHLDKEHNAEIYDQSGRKNIEQKIEDFIEHYSPSYIRAHNPVESYIPLIQHLQDNGLFFVYDEMDYWEDFKKKPWGQTSHKSYERMSDGIVSVSYFLEQKHNLKLTTTIPNAVSADFFKAAANLEKAKSEHPSVIYVGAMWPDWFDWNLMIETVQALPEIAFVLIGRWTPPAEENHGSESVTKAEVIKRFKNVTMIEEMPHKNLIQYLKNSDVGVIPFHVNDLTVAASPLKAYDYLACGLPIVSTLLPGIKEMPHTYLAKSYQKFIDHIQTALVVSPASETKEAIDNYISENLWDDRLNDLDRFVIDGVDQKSKIGS